MRADRPNAGNLLPFYMATLTVKVVPGSSRDRIAGRYGDGIKVQVSAAPERGKANEAVIKLLAVALGVGVRDIEVISGHTRPRKLLRIDCLDKATLAARVASLG